MKSRYFLCIDNTGYEASLERRKVYEVGEPDEELELVRVIDESGEDYLFPRRLFVEIELPATAQMAFAAA